LAGFYPFLFFFFFFFFPSSLSPARSPKIALSSPTNLAGPVKHVDYYCRTALPSAPVRRIPTCQEIDRPKFPGARRISSTI
ncbi:hypothetical protein QBC35DRAFT_498904, partial [Podospora australis]